MSAFFAPRMTEWMDLVTYDNNGPNRLDESTDTVILPPTPVNPRYDKRSFFAIFVVVGRGRFGDTLLGAAKSAPGVVVRIARGNHFAGVDFAASKSASPNFWCQIKLADSINLGL